MGALLFVVIELFTSQGCSSCPPADALLSELAGRDEVIPLAYHVDYWDHLGWKDPFSSESWSERQAQYARAFGRDGVYTPQLVVDGRAETVGSDRGRVDALIADAAARQTAGRVALEQVGPAMFKVSSALVAPVDGRDPVVRVVLFENGISTKVMRGENAGRTLKNDFIVRQIRDAPLGSGTVRFEVAPDWRADRLGVAAFIQDRATMKVYGAVRVLHIR